MRIGKALPGEPAQVMTTNTHNLLRRLHQTTPLPISHEKVLKNALPEMALSASQKTVVWQNLMRSVNVGTLVHFEMEAVDGLAFWIRMGTEVPIPIDLSDLFVIGKKHPYRDAIGAWVTEAYKVETEIDDACTVLAEFFRAVKHPHWVNVYWPELMAFIGPLNPYTVKEYQELKPRGYHEAVGDKKIAITDALTKSVMLPIKECNAWVAYAGQEATVVI